MTVSDPIASFFAVSTMEKGVRAASASALALVLMSTPLFGQANAQGVDEEDAVRGLDTIVVTAQKRAENVQDVPISITAFNDATLIKLGATSLRGIEAATPNLTFGSGGRASRGEIGIRGVTDNSRNIGSDARVGVYVDGVYMGRSYAADPDLLGVERVEVLRGPQGTLFGRNTVAGAINITTRAPADTFEAELVADIGNLDYRRIAGRVDLPLSDKASLALTLGKTERDGFIRNVTLGNTFNGIDRFAGRGALRLDASEQLSFTLAADYMDEDVRQQSEQAIAGPAHLLAPDIFEAAHDADGFDARNIWGASLTTDYAFANGIDFTSITAMREAEFDTRNIEEDYSPGFVAISNFNEDNSQFTQEIRLSNGGGDRLGWVAGLYYLDTDISTRRNAVAGPLFPTGPGVTETPGKVTIESLAAFVDAQFQLTDRLELTGGIRWTQEDKSLDYSISDGLGFFVNFDNYRDSLSDTDLSPRAGVNYHVSDDVMVYASYARAFKSGGWNADFITTLDQIDYGAEQADNFEIGLKSTLLDNRLRFNLSAFSTAYDQFQIFQFVQVATGGTIITVTNAGEATTEGVEAEVVWRPMDRLTITANGAWTDAVFDRFRDGGGPGIDFDGNQLPYAPEWKHFVSAEYVFPLGQSGDLTAYASYSDGDDYYTNPNNDPLFHEVAGVGLVNARLTYSDPEGRYEVALWGENLTDEHYYRSTGVSFLGVPRGVAALPRTWGVRLSARY
jgi:iron complex outermembrane recepter protein